MTRRTRTPLRAALLAASALTLVPLSSGPGTRLDATEWKLFVDFGLFWVCATACPDGAEESEYCCWIP